jgi:hypothetical protein
LSKSAWCFLGNLLVSRNQLFVSYCIHEYTRLTVLSKIDAPNKKHNKKDKTIIGEVASCYQAKPSQAKPSQAKPSQAKPSQAMIPARSASGW